MEGVTNQQPTPGKEQKSDTAWGQEFKTVVHVSWAPLVKKLQARQ